MIAMPTIYITRYDRLILNDLGKGICYGIASSATYNIIHRAFRRCQSRASAEGYVFSALKPRFSGSEQMFNTKVTF